MGVLVLVGFDPSSIGRNDFTAELALIGSAICYALGAVYARRYVRGLRPVVPATFQVGIALIIMTVLAFVFEHPLSTPITPESVIAVVWLGLLGSGLAYLINFRLLKNWGAARTSLVAYLLAHLGHRAWLHRAWRTAARQPFGGNRTGDCRHRRRQSRDYACAGAFSRSAAKIGTAKYRLIHDPTEAADGHQPDNG